MIKLDKIYLIINDNIIENKNNGEYFPTFLILYFS